MNKKSIGIWFLVFVLVACGEKGVKIDIEKVKTVAFEIFKDEVNANPDSTYQLKKEIAFAREEFNQYINDTKAFKIEKLQIEISGFEEAIASSLKEELQIEAEAEGPIFQLLNATDLRIENTGKVLLFEVNDPFSLPSEEQILTLESISD